MSRRSERRRRLLQRSQKFQRERLRDAQEKFGLGGSRLPSHAGPRPFPDDGKAADDDAREGSDMDALFRDDDNPGLDHAPFAATSPTPASHDTEYPETSPDAQAHPAPHPGGVDDPDLNEIGRAPGELPTSSPFESEGPTRFRVLHYTADCCTQTEFSDVDNLSAYAEKQGVVWVQMLGITDPEIVHLVGAIFNLPMLAQEDVLAEWSRFKFDEHGDMVLAVARAVPLRLGLKDTQPKGQQISFIAGSNFVISFHENDEHVFETIERRIRENTGRQRHGGPGYLFYALFDTLVDRMLYLADEIEDSISETEDRHLQDSSDIDLGEVHRLRRIVGYLGRLSMPLRETVRRLQRSDHKLLQTLGETMYFSDLYDHVLRAGDRFEHSRVMLQEIHDYHLTLQGVKTNEIIRLLTVISSVFIPLTFVVGIYGMNFENMPELKTRYGYYVCLAAMFSFVALAFFYFRKKKWL
ncbi:MAG: magnesium/cobalt transporter CorA [Puniceicoccales bacterium]|jgi:magnesium transporter|nr:magnesium/cobalt transporter CorA [Puniceicoccales bacterium]